MKFGKVIDYLNLNGIGALEFLFALYIILCGYEMFLSSSVLVAVLMFLIAFNRKGLNVFVSYKPLTLLVIYVMMHDFLYMFMVKEDFSTYYKNYIGTGIIMCLIPWIAGAMDYKYLKCSLNIVVIISSFGIVYHLLQVANGNHIQPLRFPFLPFNMSNPSLNMASLVRPTSFFTEPQAFVSFALVPLFISLTDKKYIFCAFLLLSILLSTSTTGIFASFLILPLYVIRGRFNLKSVFFLLLAIGLLYYLLTSAEVFTQGLEKLERTDFSTTERLNQGVILTSRMKGIEFIFGAPYFSSTIFCIDRGLASLINDGSVFVSTFWSLLLRYGVIGLFFYFYVFYRMIMKDKSLIPYTVVYIATIFSNPDTLGAFYAYSCVFMLVYIKRNEFNQKHQKILQ